MKIKPCFNQILIEPVEKKQTLVSDEKSLCEYGKVIAVGEDVKTIKEGDVIAFLLWGINHLDLEDGKRLYFVSEDPRFILGKLEDD